MPWVCLPYCLTLSPRLPLVIDMYAFRHTLLPVCLTLTLPYHAVSHPFHTVTLVYLVALRLTFLPNAYLSLTVIPFPQSLVICLTMSHFC